MTRSIGHLCKLAALAALALSAVACGSSENQASVYSDDITYDLYFDSFGGDFEPADTLIALAGRSDLVTPGVLVDVTDGPVFGQSFDDADATRHLVLVFETETDGRLEQSRVLLPRPNTSRLDTLKPIFPMGAQAALYLTEFADLPEAEIALWHNLERPLWQPTTPQGIVWERNAGDTETIEVPLQGGSDFPFADAPPEGAEIAAWLPPPER